MLFLNIPKDIEIKISDNWIELKGPLGLIKKKKSNLIKLFFEESTRKLWLTSNNIYLNNFYTSMLNKLIWGIWKGYSIKLNIIGVGYKVFLEKDKLIFKIGFSHNITYDIPKDIKIKISSQKALVIIIFGSNLQKITQVAAEIKALKPVEPYKGKGIRYFNENIKIKEGKKTNV